jgi:hypothetical protein
MRRLLPLLIAALLTAIAAPVSADPRAEIVLLNADAGTGLGLDDPTPVEPIGGNTVTTLGQQRQIDLLNDASLFCTPHRSGRVT